MSAFEDIYAVLRMRAEMNKISLPSVRFFTANESFFNALSQYKEKFIFECGAGCGDTSKEARDRGYKMTPVDVFKRDDQVPFTYICDAQLLPFEENSVALICRPDHAGWCDRTLMKQIDAGGVAIYVGLEKNYNTDIDMSDMYLKQKYHDVGEEGENMWVFYKRKKTS